MTKLPIRVFLAITIGATGGVVLYLAQKKLAKKKSDSYAEVKDSQEEQEKTTNQQNWEDSVFNNPNVTILESQERTQDSITYLCHLTTMRTIRRTQRKTRTFRKIQKKQSRQQKSLRRNKQS